MAHLRVVSTPPVEENREVVTIETYGDLFGDLHKMLEDAAASDGDIGAVLLRLASLAVEHEDVPLLNVRR